jgi:hypothetical protein
MWQAAGAALKAAESAMIFGFSIPESDDHIVEFLKHTIGSHGNLKKLAIVDIDPEGPLERLKRFVPIRSNVDATLFRVPIDGSTPSWFPQSGES